MKTILLFVIALCSAVANAAERTVVMISLDGAKPSYFSKEHAPHIYKMGQQGWAASMQPVFPSITFPNHASLVTGCTTEQHGIVSNSFEDPQRGHFDMSPDASWMQCEPLWVTAHRAGLKSAIALWPMSWAPWQGVRATYYFPANPRTKSEATRTSAASRLTQIITWLKLPANERPRLILSWLGEIDHQGHRHGPDSPEVHKAVRKYDTLIGFFLRQLRQLPVGKFTDVIIVSDHGMSTTKNYISLDYLAAQLKAAHVTPKSIEHSGPLAMIYLARSAQTRQAEKRLGSIGTDSAEFTAYTQKTLPKEWHFRTPRSGNVILVARTNDVFTKRGKGDALLYTPKNDNERGNHGYPSDDPEMQAIFFAQGPDFPHNDSPAHFKAIDVAPLIKRILSLP